MAGRRRRDADEPAAQERFAWADGARVLEDAPAGEVVYEAPELRRVGRKRGKPVPVQSIGLPFGAKEADGRSVCWSCGSELDEERVVRGGPGDARCPGCGAKLPFY